VIALLFAVAAACDAVFLTIDEVAALLRTTPSALYSQRHRREAPGSLGVRVGRRILWRLVDVETWFDRERDDQSKVTS